MSDDIGPALALAKEYDWQLLTRDVSTVMWWLKDGCDMERDILPTMRLLMGRKRGIGSFGYFTAAVMKARDVRLATPEVKPSTLTPERIAEIAAWKRKMGMASPTDERLYSHTAHP